MTSKQHPECQSTRALLGALLRPLSRGPFPPAPPPPHLQEVLETHLVVGLSQREGATSPCSEMRAAGGLGETGPALGEHRHRFPQVPAAQRGLDTSCPAGSLLGSRPGPLSRAGRRGVGRALQAAPPPTPPQIPPPGLCPRHPGPQRPGSCWNQTGLWFQNSNNGKVTYNGQSRELLAPLPRLHCIGKGLSRPGWENTVHHCCASLTGGL